MKSAAAISLRSRTITLHTLIALTLAFFALAASSAAWAEPPGRVGRIADTDGNVWLYEDEQGEWVQAQRNRPVSEGDRLSAERGARAEIQIGGGTLRLDGGADVEFIQLNDARVHVRVLGGTVALRVRSSRSAREFALLTEEGRYEPLRPGHYRVDVEDHSSIGETLAGAMRFEARDSVLEIADGQRAEFWQERGVTHYAWTGPSNDRFGDWVAREDREDSRERSRYVSEEMTGAEDLDRHGHWDRHPEYGAVWYPRVVVAGWAPYRYGHWSWINPWGWTWVDDAPWGFAPFHYGRWVNYGGRWGWAPGQYVARPVYAPALVAWFGGPRVSVGINIGGPAVGWVPLAPREIYYPAYHHSPNYVRNVNSTHTRWHGPQPRYERPVRTGPIMYTNQGVAGGVTVVPQNVMQSRQPISPKVAVPVDARTVSSWQSAQPTARSDRGGSSQRVPSVNNAPPAPPSAAVIAARGAVVPAPPNAARNATWSRAAPRVPAAQGDGGQAPSRGGVGPSPQAREALPQRQRQVEPASGGAVTPTPAPVPQVQSTMPPQRGSRPERPERPQRDDGREDRGERRGNAPTMVQPQQTLPQPPTPQRAPQVQQQSPQPQMQQRPMPPQVQYPQRPVQPQMPQQVQPPQVQRQMPPQVPQPQAQVQRQTPPQAQQPQRPVQPQAQTQMAPQAQRVEPQRRGGDEAEPQRGAGRVDRAEQRYGESRGEERPYRGRDQQQVR